MQCHLFIFAFVFFAWEYITYYKNTTKICVKEQTTYYIYFFFQQIYDFRSYI